MVLVVPLPGCALVLHGAAIAQPTTDPPAISLFSDPGIDATALSASKCPAVLQKFIDQWTQAVPNMRGLSPDQSRLLRISLCKCPSEPVVEHDADLLKLNAIIRGVAAALGSWSHPPREHVGTCAAEVVSHPSTPVVSEGQKRKGRSSTSTRAKATPGKDSVPSKRRDIERQAKVKKLSKHPSPSSRSALIDCEYSFAFPVALVSCLPSHSNTRSCPFRGIYICELGLYTFSRPSGYTRRC